MKTIDKSAEEGSFGKKLIDAGIYATGGCITLFIYSNLGAEVGEFVGKGVDYLASVCGDINTGSAAAYFEKSMHDGGLIFGMKQVIDKLH